MITALTVNYNTPDLLNRMVKSFRQFYDIELVIVDGSDANYMPVTKVNLKRQKNIRLYQLGYNIHHGAGLCYGMERIDTEKVLFIDSDVLFLKHGFLEDLNTFLSPKQYGVGDIQIVDEKGMNVPQGIKYLHPALCLINTSVFWQFKLPINHGAPMIESMKDIHGKGLSDELLVHRDWVNNDFKNDEKKYLAHNWQGTVKRFGYGLNK